MSRESDLKRALALTPASPTAEDLERRDAAIAAAETEAIYQAALASALRNGDLRGVPDVVVLGEWERFKRDLEGAVTAPGPRWSLHVAALDDRKRVLEARGRLLDGSVTPDEAAQSLGLRRWTILLGTLDDAEIAGIFGDAA